MIPASTDSVRGWAALRVLRNVRIDPTEQQPGKLIRIIDGNGFHNFRNGLDRIRKFQAGSSTLEFANQNFALNFQVDFVFVDQRHIGIISPQHEARNLQ